MSSKKSKLLESAQKNFLKGQYDRAISDYRQLMQLEPSDLRHRQRVAEILTKANQKEDAIKEYSFLAKHYVDSVHYLKAIAVYKQIQKLDPTNPETAITLASLNEKQGLIGNATAEYASAVQIYERTGENLKALKALESIMSLDSGNSAVKLRVAEKYYSTGSEEKSFDTFVSLLQELKEKSDENGFSLISERAVHLFGNRINEFLERTAGKDSVNGVQNSNSAPEPAETLPQSPDSSLLEPIPAGMLYDFSTDTDDSPSIEEPVLCEDIEYIEDILPIDDNEQVEEHSSAEGDDSWEEEIDLLSLDAPPQPDTTLEEEQELLEILETADELDELELELDIEEDPLISPDIEINIPFQPAEETFDLGRELSLFADEIDFELFPAQNSDTAFDITSSGFKKAELDNEDSESHYSLGLAYKEMGLFDEAIGEFIVASRSKERKIDAQILQAVCLRELGNITKAVEMLSDTLLDGQISENESLGVQYELALCHEASGDFASAREILTAIHSAHPTFSNVAASLKNLPL